MRRAISGNFSRIAGTKWTFLNQALFRSMRNIFVVIHKLMAFITMRSPFWSTPSSAILWAMLDGKKTRSLKMARRTHEE
jgi:hypothetical protein